MNLPPSTARAVENGKARDVLSVLRHELRTPVNHLLGYAELLLEDAPDDNGPWGSHLQRIYEAGREVLAPIDDLIVALRDRADTEQAVTRIRHLLGEVDDDCALLDAEAHRRGATDAIADLAIIRNAAAHLLELVTRPFTLSGSEADEAEQRTSAPNRSPDTTENPVAILVVDDNAQNCEILSRRLSRLGHIVEVASGGHDALALLRSRPFDLLLLDVMMPDLDGYEVLARLKADSTLRELPVIMLSALDEVAAAARCIEMGADDYLTKPIDTVLLRARVGACLERKRLRDTEVAYLRQAAYVTGPAIIARALTDTGASSETDDDERSLRAAVVHEVEWVDVSKGEALFMAGDPGDSMYVVLSGRLRIDEMDERGQPRPRGEVRRGSTIGELEILTGQARATTVTAVRDARVARIPQDCFERLARDYPRQLTATTRDVVDRLRDAFQRRPDMTQVTTFALIPVSSGVPVRPTVDRLTGALAGYGATLLLDREHLAEVLGHDATLQLTEDARTERLAAWLNEFELRYRYVVYLADPEPSAWTQRCLRQADHVLLLGHGQPPVDSTGLMREISRNAEGAPIDLLLLHDPATQRPAGTADWLRNWDVRLHHHLRLEDNASLARLVRRLTGTSIDLVLGGGGARGCAHLGVLRAIEEAGIPIDAIGGTSIGALFGGAAAAGMSWQDMQSHVHSWSSSRRLFDYTLPFVSLLRGGRITSMLQDVYGQVAIEDLWRGFFSISSSLTRARPVVQRHGPLWSAVRASISMPIFLPPVHAEGELLIDGAYLNNMPTDVMRDLYGSGVLIAVNVNEAVEPEMEGGYGPSLSGWHVLRRRLGPRAAPPHMPSIPATILRTGSLHAANTLDTSTSLADLVITPPVGRFSGLDFGSYAQIIDAGYEAACRQIEQWQRARDAEAAPTLTTHPVAMIGDARPASR